MTRFAQAFSRAAGPNLIRQFGEPVTYQSTIEIGGSETTQRRTVQAIIERQVNQSPAEIGDQSMRYNVVRVLNNCTTGVGSKEIDPTTDTLWFPNRVGEEPKQHTILHVESDANGMLRIVCQ